MQLRLNNLDNIYLVESFFIFNLEVFNLLFFSFMNFYQISKDMLF